ncbi:MAG: undecaprenyl-diphosphatase UppP [Desulfobulbaceae bacterium]|uniref:Undecaprenyl-diphosphatase n=1 Tax=Candidatus Desulfobia pelagia TaxID=2841692 RepID=A0A8J6NEE1_9BACT|nr:undecaprenyl-diphosphatase UppP [Candidatus Desulfobia pelagia]
MDLLYAALLGFLQGATEFLPVSSSGHLALAEHFFHVEQAGLTFDVALHIGTLLAILVYFRKDLLLLAKAFFGLDKSDEAIPRRRQAFGICLATVPAVVCGLLFGDAAETIFRSPLVVACTLSVAGFFLLLADKKGTHQRTASSITIKDAVIIGCAQALALIPGVSRSGSTMTAALFLGVNRSGSALFSFLLSAPIIFGAGIYNIPKIMDQGLDKSGMLFYATGFVSAAVSGYIFISFLMRFVRTKSLAIFAYYRFALSGLVVIALLLGY